VTDQAFSALLDDLESRGLLDETLIVWGGEMGRTPRVGQSVVGGAGAGRDGRDHWPHVFTTVLAGGGVKGGLVYGSSDRYAAAPASQPTSTGRPGGHYLSLSGRRSEHAVDRPPESASTLCEGTPIQALLSLRFAKRTHVLSCRLRLKRFRESLSRKRQRRKKRSMKPASSQTGGKQREWSPRIWEGCDFFAWMRLLSHNRFAVHLSHLHIAVVVTLVSIFHTLLRWLPARSPRQSDRPHSHPDAPIFIIGHWRTGTDAAARDAHPR